jgi:hypothetical protein
MPRVQSGHKKSLAGGGRARVSRSNWSYLRRLCGSTQSKSRDTLGICVRKPITALYLRIFLPTIPMPNCYLCAMVFAAAPF